MTIWKSAPQDFNIGSGCFSCSSSEVVNVGLLLLLYISLLKPQRI